MKSTFLVTSVRQAHGVVVLALWMLLVLPAPLRADTGKPPERPPAALDSPLFAALWRESVPLVTLRQSAGQSDERFLLHVAATVDALTDAVAAEVCGVFEQDDSTMRLVITLMTQGSPSFCLNPAPSVVGGPGSLRGASIHSHVDAGPRTRRSFCGARPAGARFTAMDYAAGAGFLVYRGRLWHQRGEGTQRYVARLDAASTPPEARLATRTLMGNVRACA